MKLFTENITEYFAHVQAVCTRPLLRGEGPRDEASEKRYQALSSLYHTGSDEKLGGAWEGG